MLKIKLNSKEIFPHVFNEQISEPIYNIDSTEISYFFEITEPEYLFVLLDRSDTGIWKERAWIGEEGVNERTLNVNFSKREASWQRKTDFDKVFNEIENIEKNVGSAENIELYQFQSKYISENPNSYLALSFVLEQMHRFSEAEALVNFNKLDKRLERFGTTFFNLKQLLTKRRYPNVGEPFTDLKLFNKDGESLNFSEYNSELQIIHLWSNDCGYSVRSLPEVMKLQKQYQDKVGWISISLAADSLQWVEDSVSSQINWFSGWLPFGFYGDFVLNYNITATPTFLLVDKNHKLVSWYVGSEIYLLKEEMDKFLSKSN